MNSAWVAIITSLLVTTAHAEGALAIPSVAGLDTTTVSQILDDYRECIAENVELAAEFDNPVDKAFVLEDGERDCSDIRNSEIRIAQSKVKTAQAQDRIDAANDRMSRLTAEVIANARKELGL